MKKNLIHIFLIALLSVLFIQCGTNDAPQQSENKHVKKSVIDRSDEIVSLMFEARAKKKQITPLTNTFGEYTLEEAYTLQNLLEERLRPKLGDIAGYKMAYASKSAIEKNNLSGPVYGPFFENQKIENGGEVNLNDYMKFHIENEIAFVMKSPVNSPVKSVEELKLYVKSIHLSLDISNGRFDRSNGRETVNDFVASGGGAHRYVLGKPVDGIDHPLENLMLYIEQNNDTIYKGNTNEVYGNPWNALLWIVNDLIKHGKPVKENMFFLTGKVDSPYAPEGNKAIGEYIGSCVGFPEVKCIVSN